jgi:hypothetical protein
VLREIAGDPGEYFPFLDLGRLEIARVEHAAERVDVTVAGKPFNPRNHV